MAQDKGGQSDPNAEAQRLTSMEEGLREVQYQINALGPALAGLAEFGNVSAELARRGAVPTLGNQTPAPDACVAEAIHRVVEALGPELGPIDAVPTL